jgi:hypothetical protein
MSGATEVSRALAERGVAPVVVSGGCMEPAFRDGQWVMVHVSRPPRPGDVALLNAGGVLELHRLGARAGRWFFHKGDASPAWGVARREEILGIVDAPPAAPSGPREPLLRLLLLRIASLFVR